MNVRMIKAGGTPAVPGKDCPPPSFFPYHPGHPLIPRITVQKLSLPLCKFATGLPINKKSFSFKKIKNCVDDSTALPYYMGDDFY